MGTFATAPVVLYWAIPSKPKASAKRFIGKRSPCGCSPRHRRRYAEIEFTFLPCVLKQNERIRGFDNLQVQALLIPVRRILRDDVVVETIGG